MALISVIIPAYNAEKYLREALDSALAQTHPQTEVVVVDDGSTDGTPEILKAYGSRITIVRQANRGVATACNAGVAAAMGKWIAFLDADDVWLPNKLALQLERCRHLAISHTDSVCFGDALSCEVRRSSFEPPYAGNVLRHLLVRNFITKSTVMMLREVFIKYDGFDASYAAVEDWPFFLKVCAEYELGYLPEALVRYRVHRKSKSMQSRKTLADHVRVIHEAFAPGGVGTKFPELRAKALASSYQVNCHYAAESGDWTFAVYCALKSLQIAPTDLRTWKNLVKAVLIPVGIEY